MKSWRKTWIPQEIFSPQNITKILENRSIYREAINLNQQQKLSASALDKLQSDKTHLSDAVEIWLDLMKEPLLEHYLSSIKKRFDDAMTPFLYIANMTEPRYQEKNLTAKMED